jgi:hypothetical protein
VSTLRAPWQAARSTGMRLPMNTVAITASAKPTVMSIERFAQQRHREQHAQERLHQLHLADPHRAAQRQAAVPGKKAEPHRDQRHIGEPHPGAGGNRMRWPGSAAMTGKVTGRLITSTQQITRSAPSFGRQLRPPLT